MMRFMVYLLISYLMFTTAFYTPGLIYKHPESEIGAHYTVENLPFVVTFESMNAVQSTSSFF